MGDIEVEFEKRDGGTIITLTDGEEIKEMIVPHEKDAKVVDVIPHTMTQVIIVRRKLWLPASSKKKEKDDYVDIRFFNARYGWDRRGIMIPVDLILDVNSGIRLAGLDSF